MRTRADSAHRWCKSPQGYGAMPGPVLSLRDGKGGMEPREGFEPPTPALRKRCCYQLSYRGALSILRGIFAEW
jgi:hypothetical protein